MSDISDPKLQQSQQSLESTWIRKSYSQPFSAQKASWRTMDASIPDAEIVDYFDEKDFRNTDRYGYF